MSEDLRYPIGPFAAPAGVSSADRTRYIDQVAEAPGRLRTAVSGLDEAQLATPYRPGGWTVRQVVHHVPDSHMNASVRFRLALTEDAPTIRPYQEALWAGLPDARTAPIDWSLALLESLHERWVMLLRSMTAGQFERGYFHPEHNRTFPLSEVLAMYAWHGRHHVAHITRLRQRMGWGLPDRFRAE